MCIYMYIQWLCNLPELHVFGGIQYSFLLQEALNFLNIICRLLKMIGLFCRIQSLL